MASARHRARRSLTQRALQHDLQGARDALIAFDGFGPAVHPVPAAVLQRFADLLQLTISSLAGKGAVGPSAGWSRAGSAVSTPHTSVQPSRLDSRASSRQHSRPGSAAAKTRRPGSAPQLSAAPGLALPPAAASVSGAAYARPGSASTRASVRSAASSTALSGYRMHPSAALESGYADVPMAAPW